ncbi:MAG: SCO family protein, partial [Gammaproteobacteria bacterium]|nr:SCO family protein [Gammaproteobacteria bacterium]
MTRSSLTARVAVLFILLSLIVVVWNAVTQRSGPPQELVGVLRLEPRTLKPFELVDQKGGPVNEHMFKDKWSFVFFGYTSCPDICPTTLHVLNTVTEKLAVQDRTLLLDAQVVFISVDPDRDNLDMLAEYMAYFNESFIGITGDKNNIDNITRQFGAGY